MTAASSLALYFRLAFLPRFNGGYVSTAQRADNTTLIFKIFNFSNSRSVRVSVQGILEFPSQNHFYNCL
ncbi:MAG: hypothetical protein SPF98_02005 [Campylobacter sp.]|nr:hypothetical protein [Campylobacter sp.]